MSNLSVIPSELPHPTAVPSLVSPRGSISADVINGTAPLRTTFTANITAPVDGYVWDFGDGGTSYDQNPLHIYANAGNYSVKLVTTGPEGSDEVKLEGYDLSS